MKDLWWERPAGSFREVLKGAGIPYELVLVNDGSSDNTWEEILKAGHKDPAVLGVRFSRNFGKEAAVLQEWHRHQGCCCSYGL